MDLVGIVILFSIYSNFFGPTKIFLKFFDWYSIYIWNIFLFFVFCLKNFREVLWCAMTYPIITGSYSIFEELENELSFPNAIYLNYQSTCDLQVSYMKLDYLCLPVLTWEVGELHVQIWTTCVYLCLLER